MPWNEDPKEKSPKDLNEEQKEDSFSFLQETIKPEPITGKQVRKQLLKLAVYGIVVGAFACLGFYALNGWVKGIKCVRMELGEPDASGRRRGAGAGFAGEESESRRL